MDIRFSKTAMRALLRSNKRTLIRQKIDELANDSASLEANVKRLQGRPEYRLRVQDWRVIFRIDQDILWIDDIAPRGSAYEVNP
ncbi:type II toxin-antitoxin system RelE/ParE family toxin [Sphingobium yanoikuyae]|uniref:Type II toxin-antitoxin system RelE/ParE family toxin n=1 Tax=Sphingobium yanoikuyae TaxID=13690 RepID=A0AA43BB03_SPHYA|nr:type II toxin-antitoxin system RelE/ParE family toxin [Sphingobium yanoikuyae]MDH2130347.1 type II toxin-antitoxin system RelE/ParE family toxin [Sphingobium yanoikuyae]MDH2148311.1 type II toxin-antitoxin system RelE/ParE family toxin [Sphingobium yanoikuyae]MDH2165910.1 type II toxin-antitoxin system RelE/ParE family toxin [Sphingobium yanoikuyae]